ncbi:TPA: molecular chaperone FimC, partial [Escherichia coli]|nr:molecular chaperone FimC [Escherichia coli]
MMKHMRIWAVLASFLVFFYIPQSYAGVALGATRVIYP